jgi:alkylation response protein AidB-like acyl-CoA dehydrogenase
VEVGVDFELDDTQRTIASLAREVLTRESAESAWKALARAGLLALAVPERLGGSGLGVAEVAVLLTEVGRAGATTLPALSTLALGVLPVVRMGTAAQWEDLLPPVVAGEHLLTGAPRGTPVTVVDHTLTGTRVGVLHARSAHRILIPTTAGIYLLSPHSPGVTLTATPTSSGHPEFTVSFDHVPATLLGPSRVPAASSEVSRPESRMAAFARLATVGACAMGDGLVAGALDLTAAHLRGREQFGRPLATFQAVAQEVADVYLAARVLHLGVLSACWTSSEDVDDDGDLDVAAYWLTDQGPAALQVCHHLHGGLGVDTGYPLHRYYSGVKDLVRFLGGTEPWLDRLGGRVAG